MNLAISPLTALERSSKLNTAPYWPLQSGQESRAEFSKVSFPLMSLARVSFFAGRDYFELDGHRVPEAVRVNVDGRKSYQLHSLYGGGRIIHHAMTSNYGFVGIIWGNPGDMVPVNGRISGSASQFPAEWSAVVAIVLPERLVFNSENSMVRSNLNTEILSKIFDSDQVKRDLVLALQFVENASRFILEYVDQSLKFWIYLTEKHSEEFGALIELLEGAGIVAPIICWADVVGPQGNNLNLAAFARGQSVARAGQTLPQTDARWVLTEGKYQ